MPPSRRTFVRTAGAVLSVGSAGCLSSQGGEQTSEETPPETTTRNDPPTVREVDSVGRSVPSSLTVDSSEEPFLALAVGSRENVSNPDDNKAHVVQVWNDTGEPLSVELELTADGTTVLDDEYEFDADANLALDLRAPRRYELTVSAGDREAAVEIERGRFDCNDSATDVAIRDDEIETGLITTDLACYTVTTASDSA